MDSFQHYRLFHSICSFLLLSLIITLYFESTALSSQANYSNCTRFVCSVAVSICDTDNSSLSPLSFTERAMSFISLSLLWVTPIREVARDPGTLACPDLSRVSTNAFLIMLSSCTLVAIFDLWLSWGFIGEIWDLGFVFPCPIFAQRVKCT